MYCRNCGNKIPEGNRFCEECGAPVPGAAVPRKRNRKITMIAVFVVVIGACIGALTGYFTHQSNAEYQDKLTTAQKYLDEGNVDEAIKTFEAAIDIKPKKEKAYLELADLYITQECYYEAVVVLEQGYSNTGNKDAFKKPLKTAHADLDGSWKSSYKQVLEENSGFIKTYEKHYDAQPSVAIQDLNGDGVPELLFFAANELTDGTEGPVYAELKMYSYIDNKATAVDIKLSNTMVEQIEGTAQRGFLAYWEDDPGFIIYMDKAGGGLVFHKYEYGDPGFYATTNEIDISKLTAPVESSWIEYFVDGIGYETNNISRRYLIDGKESTEKEYLKKYDAYLEGMDNERILFCDNRIITNSITMEPDEKKIWDQASKAKPLAKSYDAAIAELEVKGGKSNAKVEDIDINQLPQQEALTLFLQIFGAYDNLDGYYSGNGHPPREYDHEHGADYPLLDKMFDSVTCVDLGLYPGVDEEHWDDGTSDPRGWSSKADALHNYRKVSEEKADWILTNIFNTSKKDLEEIKKVAREGSEDYYLQDGYYYRVIGGAGGPFYDIIYNNVKTDGKKYYIEYIARWPYDDSVDATYYTIVEPKTIDGKTYWSMYYHSEKPGKGF